MPKTHTKFTCQQCGFVSAQLFGRCPECGEWNSMVESIEQVTKDSQLTAKPVTLSDIEHTSKERIKTHISELDHVLGGGLVSGQVVLLAGEPGVGKSTLLLQMVKSFKPQTSESRILYASGEESPEQISLRARRLGFTNKESTVLTLYPETNLEAVIEEIKKPQYKLLIVDSIQTMWSNKLSGAAGSVGQVRECAYEIIQTVKRMQLPVFIVGQVTKEGSIAGPKVLEHLVDTVLYFEGERFEKIRILRVTKNRFGPTDEVGVFNMEEKGFEEVFNASELFFEKRKTSQPGSAVTVAMEGTRPLLVEIQALVSYSELKSPRRVGNGISFNRLVVVCAILSKHLRLPLEKYDVYVNVSGGLKIDEPAADLACSLAIYSSFKNKALPDNACYLGELSLLGEIRSIANAERRIREAKKMGFTTIFSRENYQSLKALVALIKG